MKNFLPISLIAAIVILLEISHVYGAQNHSVQTMGNSFSPQHITIQIGDTVTWENTGGFHNVVSDDGLFTSGAASSGNWTYSYVFSTVGLFQYYCVIHGSAGGNGMSGSVTVEGVNGITDLTNAQITFELNQNYPNPFNPSTTIKYNISQKIQVSLSIFNLVGQKIITLVNEYQSPGEKQVTWNSTSSRGEKVASGVYIYTLRVGSNSISKKLVILD